MSEPYARDHDGRGPGYRYKDGEDSGGRTCGKGGMYGEVEAGECDVGGEERDCSRVRTGHPEHATINARSTHAVWHDAPVGLLPLATYDLHRARLAYEPLDDLDGHRAKNCSGCKVCYAS